MASNINYSSYYGYYGVNWVDSSGNSNIIYSGKASDGKTYRSRIILDTTGMTISSSSRLIVKITVAYQDSQLYDKTVARLSTHDVTNPEDYFKADGYTPIDAVIEKQLSSSNFYTDSNGSTLASGYQAQNNTLYLIFNTNKIEAGKIYYIYIGREASSSSRFNAFKVSEVNLDFISYTQCGAPTVVNASGIIKPTDSFTVSWSGASSGQGQTISGYEIYYKISSDGSKPTIKDYTGMTSISSSNSSSGSATITIKGATRRDKIVCGVVTKGSAGPAYDSPINTGGEVTINSLPAAPSSIKVSQGIVPSTGGVVTFTPEYDDDSEKGQINSVYYSFTPTGTKTLMSANSIRLNINHNTDTYYFWTYDGLEFSNSYTSKTIQINTKPTCSIVLSGNSVASEWTNKNSTSSTPYIITPTLTIENGNNGQSSNKYNLWIQYSDFNSFSNYKDKQIKSNYTSTTYTIADIRKELSNKKPPYYYRAAVVRNDGIEDSDTKYSNIYYVNSVPEITQIFNKKDYSNVDGLSKYFDKALSFHFQYDESYSSFTLNNKEIKLSHDATEKTTYGQIENAGFTKSGDTAISGYYDNNKDFTYTHKDSSGNDYYIYKVKEFNINNLKIVKVNPWPLPSERLIPGRFSIQNMFGVWDVNDDTLNEFGVTSIDECFKYSLEGQDSVNIRPDSDSTYETLNFSPTWNTQGDNTDKNQSKKVTVQFINKFGSGFASIKDLEIIYEVTPQISGFSCYQATDAKLKQGQNLEFELSVSNCYNSGQQANIYITTNGIERLLKSYALAPSDGQVYETLAYTLDEIKNEEEITAFKVKITNNANTSCEEVLPNQTIKFLKHTTPDVSLIRTDYQNEGDFGWVTVYFNSNNWGLSETLLSSKENNINLTLCKNGDAISDTVSVEEEDSSKTFILIKSLGEGNWETADVYLKAEVTNNTNSVSTTYTQTATNSVIVYNLTPTIAYRKNYLGINTKTPELYEGAIMVIGNASGRDKIVYKSSDSTHPVCILVNFKIDGGTWD